MKTHAKHIQQKGGVGIKIIHFLNLHLSHCFLLFNEKIQITKFLPIFFLLILTNLDQTHRDLLKITTKNFW